MKRCHRCNIDFPDNRKFCEFCGSKLIDLAPVEASSSLRCFSCSEPVHAEWKFCKNCRARLAPPTINLPSEPTTPAVPIIMAMPTATVPTTPQQPMLSAPQPATATPKIIVRCRSCKSLMDEDSAFCESCGAKMMDGSWLSRSSVPIDSLMEPQQKQAAEAESLRIEQELATKAEQLREEQKRTEAERLPLERGRAGAERMRIERAAEEEERARLEEERAAEAERLRLEQERVRLEPEQAAKADRARIDQERAGESERLRAEEQQAAEEQRRGAEHEQVAEAERARIEQEPAAEAERRFEETWGRAEEAEEVPLADLVAVRSILGVSPTTPPYEARESPDTTGALAESRRTIVDTSTVSVGKDGHGRTSAYLPSWAMTPEVPPKRRTQWRMAAVIVVISLSAVVVIALLLNRQRATGGPSEPEPSPTIVPPQNMVYLPGGAFVMGTDGGDEYEKPAHKVTVKPFFMDINEVTCAEYEEFLEATGHKAPLGWRNGTFPNGAARKPVTGVNWDDANSYAQWAKKRLPTEEEWELAARGPEGWKYSWGNDWRQGLANADNASQGLADVGQFKGRSPFGLADMIGNAWEWTSTPIHSYDGGKIAEDQLSEVERNKMKTIRGGCYLSSPQQATTTYRRGWPQSRGPYDFNQTGFRCAQDAPSKN